MKTIVLLSTILLFASCGPDQKAIEKVKYDEVMAVHDEVMPKMGVIRKLKSELRAKVDSLILADSLSSGADDFLNSVNELELANESMMVWMRAFAEPEGGTAHNEVLKFYDSELKKVMVVRDKMLTAIENAEKIN